MKKLNKKRLIYAGIFLVVTVLCFMIDTTLGLLSAPLIFATTPTGYDEQSLYFDPPGNLIFIVALTSANALPSPLTDGSNCAHLGQIESVDTNLDMTDVKEFINCKQQVVGAKINKRVFKLNAKILNKSKNIINFIEANQGTATFLCGIYHGVMKAEHWWEFAIIRNGTAIKLGSTDDPLEFVGTGVFIGTAVTFDSTAMTAIETALSIAIHPTTATIAASTSRVLSYTAVS